MRVIDAEHDHIAQRCTGLSFRDRGIACECVRADDIHDGKWADNTITGHEKMNFTRALIGDSRDHRSENNYDNPTQRAGYHPAPDRYALAVP